MTTIRTATPAPRARALFDFPASAGPTGSGNRVGSTPMFPSVAFARTVYQIRPINMPTAGDAESPSETDLFAQQTCEQLPGGRSSVDAHVKDRKSRVTPCSAFGIKVADDRGDIRLEQTRPENDQDQPDKERSLRSHERCQADRKVAHHDEHGSVLDRPTQPEQSIGYPAAGQRGKINAGGVNADDRRRLRPFEPESAVHNSRRHEKDQQRP